MTTALAERPIGASIMERVIAVGDLALLEPEERIAYYRAVCASVGLNELTRPFEYIELNGKLTLYTRKDATDQLRRIHAVSISLPGRDLIDGVYVVTARATTADGRCEESTGAVSLVKADGEWVAGGQNGKNRFKPNGKFISLSPDDRANAMMKAETKAKRRVTLSICGLGWMDESEIEAASSARMISDGVVVDAVGTVIEDATPADPMADLRQNYATARRLANNVGLFAPEYPPDADEETLRAAGRLAQASIKAAKEAKLGEAYSVALNAGVVVEGNTLDLHPLGKDAEWYGKAAALWRDQAEAAKPF